MQRHKMRRLLLLGAAALKLASGQQTGAAPARPAFAVASVKPTDQSLRQYIDMRVLPGGTVTATAVTLKFLITVAYGVQAVQVSGGPGWIDTAKFDILAKPPDGENPQVLPMLQSLLEDRFKLVVRHDAKELSVYELKPIKAGQLGPKLKPAEPGACPATPPGENIPCGGFVQEPGHLYGHKATFSALAKPLAGIVGRPVVDKTGVATEFDLTLAWMPDAALGGGADAGRPPQNSDLPSIFTAVQEQLGLKLDAAKESTEVLVIERAEKPSEN